MAEVDLERCYQVALDVVREAGKVAAEAFHQKSKVVETKTSGADLVTDTDKKVEHLIFSLLRERCPSHAFIGEESMGEGGVQLFDGPTWIVDPIDGTSNFVHGFPFSCVSIGLAVNKEAVVGVVYNFVLDQLFAARRGAGATMNGQPIHTSQCTELSQAMLLTELGNHRPPGKLKSKLDSVMAVAREPNPVHGVRMCGSAALSMCLVASGVADAYYEYGVHCWDITAGDIIVREAGGVSLFPTGEKMDLMRRGVLCAGTQSLASQLMPHIKGLEYSLSQED